MHPNNPRLKLQKGAASDIPGLGWREEGKQVMEKSDEPFSLQKKPFSLWGFPSIIGAVPRAFGWKRGDSEPLVLCPAWLIAGLHKSPCLEFHVSFVGQVQNSIERCVEKVPP